MPENARRPARRLLRGGLVLTPDADHATALAYEGERIVWVGPEAQADSLAPDADEVVALEGALVTPGFVDAHVHLAQTGFNARGVDLAPARSRGEALDLLAAHAERHDDDVLFAYGWDDTRWPDERFTREDVDRAIGHRVGYVCRVDAHSAVVSTRLLERAPGVAQREGWKPDGWVERDAHHAVRRAVDGLLGPHQRKQALTRALRSAAAAGLVSVHELGAPHLSQPQDFATIAQLRAEEPLPHVATYWGELDAFDLAKHFGVTGLGGDLCCDGAIGSRTAALNAPYSDAPHTSGHLYLERSDVRSHVLACTARGLQAGFHVIGDRAADAVIGGFADAAEELGETAVRRCRHRIEHAELLSPEAVATMARLGLCASVQPSFDAAWGGGDGLYDLRLGPERAALMNPYADLHRAGVPLAFGSDTPITPMDPWHGVRSAVTHRTHAQRLPFAAAITAHTRTGWQAAGHDGHGTLTVGAPASYAVWDGAPGDMSLRERLGRVLSGEQVRCRTTVLAGRVLHHMDEVRTP